MVARLNFFCNFSGQIGVGFKFLQNWMINPAGIYLLKVNNRNSRTKCEICSKLTIETPERRQMTIYIIAISLKQIIIFLEGESPT